MNLDEVDHPIELNDSSVSNLKKQDPGRPTAFTCTVILRRKSTRTARNGAEYLSIEAGDRSGTFQFTCFSDSAVYSIFNEAPEGAIARLGGITGYYQDRFSPNIRRAEIITEREAESADLLRNLVESCPEDPDMLWSELIDFAGEIQNSPLRTTIELLLKENETGFRLRAAAISMHHAYRSGLLEHTVHLCRAGKALLPIYPEVHGDLAIAGLIIHDIGKILEYEGNRVTRRSRSGILQGHVVLGYRLVRKAAIQSNLDSELTERLEHIVLSHQGELEWGAAAMASTPEAVFVSMLDNLDAKMGMVQHALRSTAKNKEFSDYLPGLKASLLIPDPKSSQENQS